MRWEQKAPTLGLHPELAPLPAGRPEAPLALTHKDMCLVFCAFASWAVKTSDLQAPDAWKTGVWCVGLGKEGCAGRKAGMPSPKCAGGKMQLFSCCSKGAF